MKIWPYFFKLATPACVFIATLAATIARAVDFHCATAQDVQNALTTAAANGANNNIYLTNGYYIGNFNFVSSGGYNLTVSNEPGVANSQVVLDGGNVGRDMSLSNITTGGFVISGLTFLRDCGNTSIGALRIAGGSGADILVQNCQFLSPPNTSGEGFEIDSGLYVAVSNCTVTGTIGGGGTGIGVSITGAVNVQNCAIATNNNVGGLRISSAAAVSLGGNTFVGNSTSGGNPGGGAYCTGTATVTNNIFVANSAGSVYGGGAGGGAGLYCAGSAFIIGNIFTGNSTPNGNNAFPPQGGAGVYCAGTATVTGNTFIGNISSGNGGGGLACGNSATIFDNAFINNSAPGNGGGFYCASGASAILTSNVFSGNSGGGVYCQSPATFIGNSFAGNSSIDGGGIWCGASGMLVRNTFASNSGTTGGGAAYCSGGSFIISSNSFIGNSAPIGGGLYITGPTLTIQDNLLANNSETSAISQGGGVWADATSNLFFINNTITGNTAAGGGGGAAFEVTGTVELLNVYNNIIWGNSANGNGADVWLAGTGQKKIFEYNDVNNMYGVWDIALSNINFAPQFFNPVGGDYHFPESSPCANAGTNGVVGQPLTDLDGNNRTNSLGQIDLGCYEFNDTATHPADTNASFTITAGEFAAYAAAWKAGQSWTNAPPFAPNPNPISANYLTRAGYLMTNGLNGAYTNDGSARPTNWKPVQ